MPRLVIFNEDTLIFNGNYYFAKNPLTKFFSLLANKMGEVVLSSPVYIDIGSKQVGWIENKIIYSPRPFYDGSVLGFLKNFFWIFYPTLKNINNNVKNSDLIMIRLPSVIGFFVWKRAKKLKKSYFLYVAGDIRKVSLRGEKYSKLMNIAVLIAANLFHRISIRIAKNSLVFTTGSDLYNEYFRVSRKCINFIPSLVSKNDIYYRKDICQMEPIKILYVGRLVPVKGVRYLLEAIQLLHSRRFDVEVLIVGDGYHRNGLENIVKNKNIEKKVRFLGRIPFGSELFKIYRQSDIFVLPSLSEGIPKTIIEAMAFGLLIVATKVGGIPDIIKDKETGLLVKPRSPIAIADAIEYLIYNKDLQKKIKKNSYNFVCKHSIEAQAERMWKEICLFFRLK